jgi:hypothetical protein
MNLEPMRNILLHVGDSFNLVLINPSAFVFHNDASNKNPRVIIVCSARNNYP